MRSGSGEDGNRRTVLTVPTVLTTNRATADEQSEQTADEQGFRSGAWRGLSTLEYPHTQLYLRKSARS